MCRNSDPLEDARRRRHKRASLRMFEPAAGALGLQVRVLEVRSTRAVSKFTGGLS